MSQITSDTALQPTARTLRIPVIGLQIDAELLSAVTLTFLVTRLMVMFIIFVSGVMFPMRPGLFLYADPNNILLDSLVRDDSWWYHNIVTQGYSMGNIATGVQGNAAFFPMYPLTVKIASALTGNVFSAAVLVSNTAFFFALGFLYALTRREFEQASAARTIFYFAAAPTAVFFSAMYTESLFMLFVIATFYFARRSQWDRAAVAGMLASATRNTGVLMALVIALEAMHQNGFRFLPAKWSRAGWIALVKSWWRPILASWPGFIAAAVVPLGLLSYMGYLTNRFGDPLGFIHVQATWGRSTSPSGITKLIPNTITGLYLGANVMAGQINVYGLLNLLATLGFLPLVIMVARKMRPAYVAYVWLTFFVPLSTGTVGSMTRYILMLFPCFMLLGMWGQRSWVDRVVLGIFLPLMAFFAIVFSHWYFAG